MTGKTFTTHDIARFCDVYPSSVNNWIKAGELKAYETPGGHNRVVREDLVAFLKEHRMPIPKELSAGNRVLIVDDEPEFCGVLRRAFGLHGDAFRVEHRASGFEACVRMGEEPPDLVVLDLAMPGMHGWEVCSVVRTHPKLSRTRVVAVSGAKPLPAPEELEHHKVDAFFAKPVELDDLVAKCAGLLAIELRPIP